MITRIDDMLLSSLKTLARETALAAEPPVAHKIFAETKSTLPMERVTHVRLLDEALDEGHEWTFAHREVAFAVALQPDDRVPANAKPRPFRHGERAADAYRLSDSLVAVRDLVAAFRTAREIDAADVFNFAGGYDPLVGGDGKPLCSTEHPWEGGGRKGTWSNRFVMPMELNVVALDAACTLIGHSYVDSVGLKIRVAPKRLIVHKGLEDAAHIALDGLPPENPIERTPVVLPYLINELPWFVQTSVPGFMRFERAPLEFDAVHDEHTNTVALKGYERRCYGCFNPRAVFGSLFEFMQQ